MKFWQRNNRSLVSGVFATLLLTVIGLNIFLPLPVYATNVDLKSNLTREEIQQAKKNAERMSIEAKQKARASGAYDYDVARIIRTVIFSLLLMVVMGTLNIWFMKLRIARKLFIRIMFYLIIIPLGMALFLFTIFVIR
jgi:hypothetical protein